MYDKGDILLFALSAWRQTSWRQFKQCFDEVHRKSATTIDFAPTESATSHRWRALRELSALGHVDLELGPNNIQVHIAPPVLAALPGLGTPRAVLCGARSSNFIEDLRTEAHNAGVETAIESQSTGSPYAPARVELRAEDAACIKSVAVKAGTQYVATPPARLLAQVSISLPEYRRSLMWSDDREINWRCEDFDTQRLQFRTPSETRPERRLSRYQHPATTVWHYRLWQGNQSTEVDPDWGRYAILSMTTRRVLRYSPETRRALVPLGAPLPTLLARGFGLCSGRCPTLAEVAQSNTTGRYLGFDDVPPSIFNKVAAKLDQVSHRTR